MNIFINISHPAHVHFFKNFIQNLTKDGHKVIIASRNKEFTNQLLDYYKISHHKLTNKGKGILGLIIELIIQQIKIYKLIKKFKINIMLQIGGIFNAPIGKITGIPTIAISDTEIDKYGNKIGFGLSKHILSPDCWKDKIGRTWKNQIKYPGYHELTYLSPKYFNKEIKFENKFLLRFVGWGAGHDIGEKYLSDENKIELVNILRKHGEIYISSENPLPKEIIHYKYQFNPAHIHEFMKNCKIIIGDSATMASEAACLGIPAIYISNLQLGTIIEQNIKFGLIKQYKLNEWDKILSTIEFWASNNIYEEWQRKRCNMLQNKIEVTDWLVNVIENYPQSMANNKKIKFDNYFIRF